MRRWAPAFLVACGFLAGCSGEPDMTRAEAADVAEVGREEGERGARQTLAAWLSAVTAGNGEVACELMTGEYRRRIAARHEASDCRTAVAAFARDLDEGERAALTSFEPSELWVSDDGRTAAAGAAQEKGAAWPSSVGVSAEYPFMFERLRDRWLLTDQDVGPGKDSVAPPAVVAS
uniref:hypothetical protein n=1 Tax=Nonomuraea pusilla TaxID=46177 RepID=UPI000A8E2F11|nr:hypothetical protein [Nonomuraea pusilla]